MELVCRPDCSQAERSGFQPGIGRVSTKLSCAEGCKIVREAERATVIFKLVEMLVVATDGLALPCPLSQVAVVTTLARLMGYQESGLVRQAAKARVE
eukprot:4719042-Amphidinium_carterae.7